MTHVRPSTPKDSRPLDDAALVAAAAAGDSEAWRKLVEQYSALVYSILVRYRMDQADRDDVFQDVFTALLERVSSLRDAMSLPKWLITTTHRIAWRTMRTAGREVTLAAIPLEEESPPEEYILMWERQHLVRQALARLSGRCEKLLTAMYLQQIEPDYREIASRLSMPIGSIGPTRGRCLAKLLKILKSLGFADTPE